MNAGQIAALVWDISVWFFLLSVVAAPVVVLIRKARARGKRKFRDEPLARVLQLHPTADHSREIV